jgi:Tol biopolymer transport system component
MRLSVRHRCSAFALALLFSLHGPFVAHAQVSKVNQPLAATGDVREYRFSPDGRYIVFTADPATDDVTQVFAAPAAGGAPVPLSTNTVVNGVSALAISPDSQRVLYLMNDGVRNDVYSVPISGGISSKLSVGMQISGTVNNFAVSPDGAFVAYLADRDVDDVFELYRVPVGGGVSSKLSANLVTGGDVSRYSFTPSGDRIVYLADQNTDTVNELFSVPVAGGGAVRLNGTLVANGGVISYEIAPNGSRVVYEADQRADGVNELFSALITGGGVTNLNVNMAAGGGVGCRSTQFFYLQIVLMRFKISPDSTRVAYCADQSINDDIELFSAPIDGSAPPVRISGPLTAQGDVVMFDFSRDGSQVIYRADQISDTVDDLFVVPIGGGAAQRLSGPFPAGSAGVIDFKVQTKADQVAYVATQSISTSRELYMSAFSAGSARRIQQVQPGSVGVSVGLAVWIGGSSISFGQNEKRLVWVADAAGDGVFRAYSAPTLQAGAVVTLNGPLVLSGNVVGVAPSPIDNTVIYLADQETDEVLELYKAQDIKMSGGPVYLPAALRQSGFEVEPNDSASTATPISLGGITRVQGRFDNEYDVFRVEVAVDGPLRLSLSGLSAVQLANRTVQLQLYKGSVVAGNLVPTPAQPPYAIDHAAAAGVYFIVVYSNPAALEPGTVYELTVAR